MNGIMGFSHLLAEPTVEDDKRLEFAGIVVVNDILDLSQLDSGNLIINKTSVKLNTFLDSLFLFFKDQVELKSQYFRIEREKEDEDIFVSFDHNRTFQLFSNMISNVFKFTEKGEIIFGYSRETGGVHKIVRRKLVEHHRGKL